TGGALPAAAGTSTATGGVAGQSGAMPQAAGDATAGGSPHGGDASAGQSGAAGEGGEAPLPPILATPVAHFKLDECDGPAIDAESSTTGARYGVGCAPGKLGNAAVFTADATADGPRRIELAEEPRFDFTQELTVAAWVKPEDGTQVRTIVAK